MASSWTTIESTRTPKGIGRIKFGEKKVKVTIKNDNFDIDKTFSKDDLPDTPRWLHKTNEGEIQAFIILTNEKDGVAKVGPANGHFRAHVKSFVSNDDGEPVVKEYSSTYEDKKTVYEAFTAILELTEKGKWQNCTINHFIRLKNLTNSVGIVDDGKGNCAFKGDAARSDHLRRLQEFLAITGASDEILPYPETSNELLAEIAERVQDNDREFEILLKDGYVKDILSVDDSGVGDDVDDAFPAGDDEEEETPKAKKPTPAAKSNGKKPVKSNGRKHDPDDDL